MQRTLVRALCHNDSINIEVSVGHLVSSGKDQLFRIRIYRVLEKNAVWENIPFSFGIAKFYIYIFFMEGHIIFNASAYREYVILKFGHIFFTSFCMRSNFKMSLPTYTYICAFFIDI